jgi:hypothetical protein
MTRRHEEYREVLSYLRQPHAFTQYLVSVAIRTTFIGAAVGIFTSLLFALQASEIGRDLERSFGTLAQIVTIVTSIIIVRICRPALKLWYRVRNFDSYVQKIPAEIRDQGAEHAIAVGNITRA